MDRCSCCCILFYKLYEWLKMKTDKTRSIVNSTVIANTLNVTGFIFFYIAKYFNNKIGIILVASLFLCNSFFIINLISKTLKYNKEITNIKKRRINLLFRLLFSLFFFCFCIYSFINIHKY